MQYDEKRAQELEDIQEDSLFVYEDEHYWVLNKPYDVQIDGVRPCTLEKILKKFRKVEGNLHFCHQLDYATSGCILIARNSVSARRARVIFDRREVYKCYDSLVLGHIEEPCTITAPLREERFRSIVDPKGAQTRTDVEPRRKGMLNGRPVTLVHLYPHTGRRHQLRAHLDHIGHRIVGDVAYGGDSSVERMMLHACALTLSSPVDIQVLLPSSFENKIEPI